MKRTLLILMLASMPLVQAADAKFDWQKFLRPADLNPAQQAEQAKRREQELVVKKWKKITYYCKECNKTLTNGQAGSRENHAMRKHNTCSDCYYIGPSPEDVELHRIDAHLKDNISTMVVNM